MIVVAASVWISSLLEQDLNREATLEWLMTLSNHVHPIYVPGIALPEVGGAMAQTRMAIELLKFSFGFPESRSWK